MPETDESDWRTPLPASAPVPRREALAGNAKWARQYLAPWVQRRLRGESSQGRASVTNGWQFVDIIIGVDFRDRLKQGNPCGQKVRLHEM